MSDIPFRTSLFQIRNVITVMMRITTSFSVDAKFIRGIEIKNS
ncbi:uncharacterized protein CTRU02_208146 [Colletotrichum truncatum]|uniref:Uncharacterized protein n=1 Tax=Colletotrichum truncatum TaxID=5467 RepID=A0ACC3YWV6_COLTU